MVVCGWTEQTIGLYHVTKKALLLNAKYEGWNFNSGNYLFTTDTK